MAANLPNTVGISCRQCPLPFPSELCLGLGPVSGRRGMTVILDAAPTVGSMTSSPSRPHSPAKDTHGQCSPFRHPWRYCVPGVPLRFWLWPAAWSEWGVPSAAVSDPLRLSRRLPSGAVVRRSGCPCPLDVWQRVGTSSGSQNPLRRFRAPILQPES